jgi:hypothetical protein
MNTTELSSTGSDLPAEELDLDLVSSERALANALGIPRTTLQRWSRKGMPGPNEIGEFSIAAAEAWIAAEGRGAIRDIPAADRCRLIRARGAERRALAALARATLRERLEATISTAEFLRFREKARTTIADALKWWGGYVAAEVVGTRDFRDFGHIYGDRLWLAKELDALLTASWEAALAREEMAQLLLRRLEPVGIDVAVGGSEMEDLQRELLHAVADEREARAGVARIRQELAEGRRILRGEACAYWLERRLPALQAITTAVLHMVDRADVTLEGTRRAIDHVLAPTLAVEWRDGIVAEALRRSGEGVRA